MAIWLRAREEFADNGFQLLFIYIRAEAARLRRAPLLWRPVKKRNTHDGIPMMALPQRCANRARKSVYFLRKPKMADGRFLGFRRALLG